ncbi:hypothetical protein K1719_016098 [Acacia pycnantha]|nr:hypothetical protein K1719_016098 [Acacia pycnantha]
MGRDGDMVRPKDLFKTEIDEGAFPPSYRCLKSDAEKLQNEKEEWEGMETWLGPKSGKSEMIKTSIGNEAIAFGNNGFVMFLNYSMNHFNPKQFNTLWSLEADMRPSLLSL